LTSDKRLVKKIAGYFANKDEVIAVYLFGSYAKGTKSHLSDIDIGILFDQRDLDFINEKRNDYIVELARLLRKDIHPVILNYAGEGLMNQIFQKGKCIIKNDPKKLSVYEMITLAKIAEFAYYRHTMQSGFVKKVMGE
jgi:predicted nucleotidyltransferase